MKNFALLLGLLFFTVAGGNGQSDFSESVKNAIDFCFDKLEIPIEKSYQALQNDDYNKYPKTRCLKECMMTHTDLMKNGEINIEKIKEVILAHNSPESRIDENVIKHTHAECLATAQQKTDECDFANEYFKCTEPVFSVK